MRHTLDELSERLCILGGKRAEVLALAKLYTNRAKEDHSFILEAKIKLDELSAQMTKYKEELSFIKQDWDEIKYEYGTT